MSVCRVCTIELTEKNWFSSLRLKNVKLCKQCNLELKWVLKRLREQGREEQILRAIKEIDDPHR